MWKIIAFLAVSTAIVQGHSFRCNCGLGSGEDVCSSRRDKCVPLVVRPMELQKPPELPKPKVVCTPVGIPLPPLIPVGGPCSCQQAIVKPATIPKPACATCCAQYNLDQKLALEEQRNVAYGGCGTSSSLSSGISRPLFVDNIAISNNPASAVPADAVSMALAYNMARKSCAQNEDFLSFGFRKIPKDQPATSIRKYKNVPEENLFGINGQIVELKPIVCDNGKKSLAEEAEDALLALQEEEEEQQEQEASNLRRLTLGDIGYAPAQIKNTPFIDIPLASPILALEEKILDAANCNDGFVPGNVIIKQVPQPDHIKLPSPFPEPCDSDEDISTINDNVEPSYSGCGYFSGSSSSSSSRSNKLSRSFLLQKLTNSCQ